MINKCLARVQKLFSNQFAYLGVSRCTDNSSDNGFVRKHGAKSSSTKSPWQPVCSATFRLTYRGSFWMAHGDNAEPLNKMALWMRSLTTGDDTNIFARLAPVPWPINVNLFGSPLKAGRFSRSQCMAATKSIKPKFPCALPFEPVFKKPICARR